MLQIISTDNSINNNNNNKLKINLELLKNAIDNLELELEKDTKKFKKNYLCFRRK